MPSTKEFFDKWDAEIFRQQARKEVKDEIIAWIKSKSNSVTTKYDFINIVDVKAANVKKIELYNINGNLIKCIINKTELPISIDVSSIPAGVYIINIQIENEFLTKKFIKQ